MFLERPLGKKGLICNGFDKKLQLEPKSINVSRESPQKRGHIHTTPQRTPSTAETYLAFLPLKVHSYALSVGEHSEETLALVSLREPALKRSLYCVLNVENPLAKTLFLQTTGNLAYP